MRRQSAFTDLYEANRRDYELIHQQIPDAFQNEIVDDIAAFLAMQETDSERKEEQRRQRKSHLWQTLTAWLRRFEYTQETNLQLIS